MNFKFIASLILAVSILLAIRYLIFIAPFPLSVEGAPNTTENLRGQIITGHVVDEENNPLYAQVTFVISANPTFFESLIVRRIEKLTTDTFTNKDGFFNISIGGSGGILESYDSHAYYIVVYYNPVIKNPTPYQLINYDSLEGTTKKSFVFDIEKDLPLRLILSNN